MFHSIIDIRIYMDGAFGPEHKDCRNYFRQNRVHGIWHTGYAICHGHDYINPCCVDLRFCRKQLRQFLCSDPSDLI